MSLCIPLVSMLLTILACTVQNQAMGQEPSGGQHASPKIRVQEDASKNGWEVRVKYKDSEEFARKAEVWTLDEARELVEDIKNQTASLDEELQPAELLVIGKDGDGKVKEDDGPKLPDWAEIEHRFKTLITERPVELKAELRSLKSAYEKAEKVIEKALRLRRTLSDEEVRLVNGLVSNYNRRVTDFEKTLFQGRTMPFPRFKPISVDLPLVKKDWADARELQFHLEQSSSDLHSQGKKIENDRAKLVADRMQILFDDSVGKKSEAVTARKASVLAATDRFQQKEEAWRKEKETQELNKSHIAGQLKAAEKETLDNSAVVPAADQFTGVAGTATFASKAGVKVLKTDDKGVPLPDNEQPEGFPRKYEPGQRVAADERVYVDPEIRIVPQPGKSASSVKAGVYGKVARVDPDSQTVEIQIDPFGNRLIYSGVQASEIKEGDYVSPKSTLGAWGRSGNDPQVIRVRATNRRRFYIDPLAFLQFASQPTVGPNLTRPGSPGPDAELLPVKGGDKPQSLDKGKKGADSARIVFDDNAPKRDPKEFAELSKNQFEIKEAVVRKELERLQKQAEDATDKLSALKQKKQTTDADLAAAQAILDGVRPQGEKLKEQAKLYEKERLALEKLKTKLDDKKKQVDEEAAKLKGSKDKKAIKDYNENANSYNDEMKEFNLKRTRLADLDPTTKIAEVKRQRDKAEKDKIDLTKKQTAFETEIPIAQSSLDKAKADVKQKQDELVSLAAKKEKAIEDEKAQTKKTDSKPASSSSRGSKTK